MLCVWPGEVWFGILWQLASPRGVAHLHTEPWRKQGRLIYTQHKHDTIIQILFSQSLFYWQGRADYAHHCCINLPFKSGVNILGEL